MVSTVVYYVIHSRKWRIIQSKNVLFGLEHINELCKVNLTKVKRILIYCNNTEMNIFHEKFFFLRKVLLFLWLQNNFVQEVQSFL